MPVHASSIIILIAHNFSKKYVLASGLHTKLNLLHFQKHLNIKQCLSRYDACCLFALMQNVDLLQQEERSCENNAIKVLLLLLLLLLLAV